MKINLSEIYAGLKAYRYERGLTAENQKSGYIVNVMEKFGELAQALRDYEKYTNFLAGTTSPFGDGSHYDIKKAEHAIIDALCDIAVLTINAGADIPCTLKHAEIELEKSSLNDDYILKQMIEKCAELSYFEWDEAKCFNIILANCAYLCEQYGYNFEIAMLETIKEILESDEAKWYKADFEKARGLMETYTLYKKQK